MSGDDKTGEDKHIRVRTIQGKLNLCLWCLVLFSVTWIEVSMKVSSRNVAGQ